MRLLLVTLCALLGVASGCGSAPAAPDRLAYETAKAKMSATEGHPARNANEVAPGYEVKLTSTSDQNLNGKYRIEFEGKLKLPYNVVINTSGLTKDQLQQKIVEAYSKFFKKPPNISVALGEELRYWIEVRGLVEKPGRFLIKSSTSLDEILSMAGGVQHNSTVRYVKIQQDNGTAIIKLSGYYSGSPQDAVPPWRGGDVVFFQSERGESATPGGETSYIHFLGEIRNPGEYHYIKGADFYYYFAKAGGSTEKADVREIEILRNSAEGKKIINFSAKDPKDAPEIEPGDMIFIPPDAPTPFERKVPIIAGLVGILNTALLIILVF
jgi:protein involved in polysaccharide export with SLBB domain